MSLDRAQVQTSLHFRFYLRVHEVRVRQLLFLGLKGLCGIKHVRSQQSPSTRK